MQSRAQGGAGGQWVVVSTQLSGTWTVTRTNPMPNPNDPSYGTHTQQWHDASGDHPHSGTPICAPNDTVTLSGSGTITLTLEYRNSAGQRITPTSDRCYFGKFGLATWAMIGNSFNSPSGSADDGLNDLYVTPTAFRGGCGGMEHLVRGGSSGTYTTQTTLSLNASISSLFGGEKLIGDVGFSVAPETRGLSLWREGARGETMDDDGTIHGDTTYNYDSMSTGEDGMSATYHFTNWQLFHPSFIGGWRTKQGQDYHGNTTQIPDVFWSWDPNESADTWDVGKWSMLDGLEEWLIPYLGTSHWEKTGKSPATYPLTYKAISNQESVMAEAHYVLTMHEPNEIKTQNPMTNITTTIHPPGAGWVVATADNQTLTVGLTTTFQATLGVTVGTSIPASQWVSFPLNINLAAQLSISVGLTYNVAASNVPVGYGTRLEILIWSHDYSGIINQWDTGGFVGTLPYDIQVPYAWGAQAHTPYEDLSKGPPPI